MTRGDSWTGRIRNLDEARAALHVPTTRDAFKRGGWPFNRVVAAPVSDAAYPERAAEFAAEMVLSPNGREFGAYDADHRLRSAAARNAWWLAFGPIDESSDGALVMGEITVAPALEPGIASNEEEPFVGATTGLLRLLSPSKLINEAVAYIRGNGYWLEKLEQRGALAIPTSHTRALHRVAGAAVPRSSVTEEDLAYIASMYVTLYRFGVRRPFGEMAGRLGISREQVRDRVHRARQNGYLLPTKQGRAAAEPGPKLLAQWSPPRREGDTDG